MRGLPVSFSNRSRRMHPSPTLSDVVRLIVFRLHSRCRPKQMYAMCKHCVLSVPCIVKRNCWNMRERLSISDRQGYLVLATQVLPLPLFLCHLFRLRGCKQMHHLPVLALCGTALAFVSSHDMQDCLSGWNRPVPHHTLLLRLCHSLLYLQFCQRQFQVFEMRDANTSCVSFLELRRGRPMSGCVSSANCCCGRFRTNEMLPL